MYSILYSYIYVRIYILGLPHVLMHFSLTRFSLEIFSYIFKDMYSFNYLCNFFIVTANIVLN